MFFNLVMYVNFIYCFNKFIILHYKQCFGCMFNEQENESDFQFSFLTKWESIKVRKISACIRNPCSLYCIFYLHKKNTTIINAISFFLILPSMIRSCTLLNFLWFIFKTILFKQQFNSHRQCTYQVFSLTPQLHEQTYKILDNACFCTYERQGID